MSDAIHHDRKPTIGITVGDVSGVGPELALRCARLPEVLERCHPILYGPQQILGQIDDLIRPNGVKPSEICVCNVGSLSPGEVLAGRFTAQTGLASFTAVDRAISDAVSRRIDAVVTGPIQKEAWAAAGIDFPGHTELLGDRLGVDDCCMMLTSDTISCILATIHVPLADVAALLTSESIGRAIQLGNDALSRRLGRPARVTVCGLNPHAGENGLLGHGEESMIIEPAIRRAAAEGIQVRGPLPPDTAFTPAMRAQTDVYVCMYHDQGLIPLKALAFDDAVNVTLGLPIVRTSVDHGTAVDLAWTGTASHHSMLAAIHMAIDLAHA